MENQKPSIVRLITVPAVITFAVTLLRLFGELEHWPRPWFDTSAGGGAAVVGITWLPLIFGPYFALKLARAGNLPSSLGKAFLMTLLGLGVYVAASILFGATLSHPSVLTLLAMPVMLIAGFIPRLGWRSFGNAMFAYALAARLPVLIVMFFAMRASGGAGWGTHYDAVAPTFARLPFWQKFLYTGLLPQLTLWIGWTVVAGSLVGLAAAALVLRSTMRVRAAA